MSCVQQAIIPKRFSARFVTKLESVLLSDLEALARMVYTTCFPSRCEPIGVVSIHWEQSSKGFPAKFVTKRESVLHLDLEAFARMV